MRRRPGRRPQVRRGRRAYGKRNFSFENRRPVRHPRDPGWRRDRGRPGFVLRLNGPATEASVLANVWCESSGSVTAFRCATDAATRAALLKHFRLEKAKRSRTHARVPADPPFRDEDATRVRRGRRGAGRLANESKSASTSCAPALHREFFVRARERESALHAAASDATALHRTIDAQDGRDRSCCAARRDRSRRNSTATTRDDEVDAIEFAGAVARTRAIYRSSCRPKLKDSSGRKLANADLFPLKTSTGADAAAREVFVVDIRHHRALRRARTCPRMMPVTLRHVEADLQVQGLNPGTSSETKLKVMPTRKSVAGSAPSIVSTALQWRARESKADAAGASKRHRTGVRAGQQRRRPADRHALAVLLAGQAGVEALSMPAADPKSLRPFEVVGIPLAKPGFYVVELASPALGKLAARQAAAHVCAHFGAGHEPRRALQAGRENSVVWVTTLDSGKPVPSAQVRVTDCNGKQVATGKTDASGLAHVSNSLAPCVPATKTATATTATSSSRASTIRDRPRHGIRALGLESRHRVVAFQRAPTEPRPDDRAHTVFDRTLLRAGETVSMKHLMRDETLNGFGLPQRFPVAGDHPAEGSGSRSRSNGATGAADHSADTTFPSRRPRSSVNTARRTAPRPATTRLGRFDDHRQFRVEEFRLPVFKVNRPPRQETGRSSRQRRRRSTCRSIRGRGGRRRICRCSVSAMVRRQVALVRSSTMASASRRPESPRQRGERFHRR